jgi:hypothetical protein
VALVRGAHYVLDAPTRDAATSVRDAKGTVTVVTGEVAAAYDRVIVECADGTTLSATLLDQHIAPDRRLFAVPVAGRVARIVATRMGGVHGVFVDVSLLEEREGNASDRNR